MGGKRSKLEKEKGLCQETSTFTDAEKKESTMHMRKGMESSLTVLEPTEGNERSESGGPYRPGNKV